MALSKKYVVLCVLCLCMASFFCTASAEQEQSKEAILIVAFGTSVEKALTAYDNIEQAVRLSFPKTDIHWAWTAAQLRRAAGKDSPQQALANLAAAGVKKVRILSLHITFGQEYNDLMQVAKAAEGLPKGLMQVSISSPLMDTPESLAALAKALVASAPKGRSAEDALLFVGHGNPEHVGGVYYAALHYFLQQQDTKAFAGAVEGDPDLESCITALKASGAKKVWLIPLMTVAGDHAINDLFAKEDSWQQALIAAGFTLSPVVAGLGENQATVTLWIEKLRAAQ